MKRSIIPLGNANFLRYWLADLISSLGSGFSVIAFPLLVLSLGMGAAQAGLIGTCALVTRIACRLPGGVIADRYDRRWLMLAGDLIRLVAVGSIPLAAGAGHLVYAHLLVVAVVEGMTTALLFGPAAGIAMRDIVSKDRLPEAFSRVQASEGLVTLLGPALGGALFGIDRILPFVVDAASYAVSALLLLTLTVKPVPRDPNGTDRRWTAGVHWLRTQPPLLKALLFATLINVAGSAAEVGVVIAMRQGGASGTTIGSVMACAGVGAIIGSLLAPRLIRSARPGPVLMMSGIVWAVGLAVLALTPPAWVIAVVLVVIVGVTPFNNIPLGVAITGGSPHELLGRVSTAVGMVTGGVACLGPILAGTLLQGASPETTWLVLAGIAAFATAVFTGPLLGLAELVPSKTEVPENVAV